MEFWVLTTLVLRLIYYDGLMIRKKLSEMECIHILSIFDAQLRDAYWHLQWTIW